MEKLEVLESVLDEVEAKLAAKMDEYQKMEAEVMELQRQTLALESLISDYRSPVKAQSNGWVAMPRTQAVEKMLRMMHKPMSPTQVTTALAGVGREDTASEVGATLAYLHQKNRIKSLGRGQWVPVEQEDHDEAKKDSSTVSDVSWASGGDEEGSGEGQW